MLYSVRMRAAKGGAHEYGGEHISGAERLLKEAQVEDMVKVMVHRALTHSRGKADFIRLTIDRIKEDEIQLIELLPIKTFSVQSLLEGRIYASELLVAAGVTGIAAEKAMEALLHLGENMRGAMVVCSETGERLDSLLGRGIRVSKMDTIDPQAFSVWLGKQGLTDIHVREAAVLAAKVNSAPSVVAELCWSDDPDYVTGYVAAKGKYNRITQLKELGSRRGGRVFFVKRDTDMEALRVYLEEQPVLAIERKER